MNILTLILLLILPINIFAQSKWGAEASGAVIAIKSDFGLAYGAGIGYQANERINLYSGFLMETILKFFPYIMMIILLLLVVIKKAQIMRKHILITVLVLVSSTLLAQDYERPLNSIQVNLLGDASEISINYEKQFLISPSFILSNKLGLGYIEPFEICVFECSPLEKHLTIPHHITGNVGKGKHFFEFGLGGTIISGGANLNYISYPIVGYRILPLNSKKLNFRVFGHIPFTGLEEPGAAIYFIPFGLSLGISF